MINEKAYALGANRSCIRDLFEYGLKRAAEVGAENVFDYSLGNPSIPAPPQVGRALQEVLAEMDSLSVHGYTPAIGDLATRKAIADDLNHRFHAGVRPEDLFIGCGAAPELVAVLRALAVEDAEVVAIAPYFPEYKPFAEEAGLTFRVAEPDVPDFQIRPDAVEAVLNEHTAAVIVNSPNNPSGTVYTEQTLRALAALLTERQKNTAIPSIFSPTSPTGSWCTAVRKRPLSPTSTPTPWYATPIPSPFLCPVSGSAISMCRSRLPIGKRSMPPSPARPGPQVMCAPPASGRR